MSAVERQPEQPLCIHFVNTVDQHGDAATTDRFSDLEGYIAWTGIAGLMTKGEQQRWLNWTAAHRSEASRTLASVVRFREYLYELLLKSATAQRVNRAKLGELNAMLAASSLRRTLRLEGDRVTEAWECDGGLVAPLHKVAVSAADVLLDGSWRKVVACSRDNCDWLAVDTSRNHSRRYCSAAGCGNLERVQRHYRKHRAGARLVRQTTATAS